MRVESHRPVGHTVNRVGNAAPVLGRRLPNGQSAGGVGRSAVLMTGDDAATWDAYPTTTRCAWCDKTHISLAGEGRDWFRAHLAERHPEVKPARRRPTNRSGWVKTAAEVAAREVAMVTVEARRKQMT